MPRSNSIAVAEGATAITTSDSTPQFTDKQIRGLYTGSGGTIVMRLIGDTADVTYTNVPAGAILPLAVSWVKQTNTTATGLVALM